MSIRTRLTLWYAAAFGTLLLVVGLFSYATIARTTRADADLYLVETASAVATSFELALDAALPGRGDADIQAAARITLANHRYRDIGVALFKSVPGAEGTEQLVLLGADTTSSATRELGGAAGWRHASASAVRAGAQLDTDVTTLLPHRERVVSLPVSTRRGAFVVSVSQALDVHDGMLARVREVMLVGLPLALLLATVGGYLLAAASLRPVDDMRRQADRISERTLHERLPVSRPLDELARLSLTFNALLDRVEDAFAQRRRFTADASHELRTPVSVIIGEAELALADERPLEAYRHALRIIHGEAKRLSLIVGDLFLLARAEASEQPLARRALFLEELVGDCVDAIGTLAHARHITVEFSPVSEVPYHGDDALLRRVVMNLLDNAVKYTGPGGRVVVEALPLPGAGAEVRVRDTGRGVPPEDHERIFERFFRAEHTRTVEGIADASGSGLGLPIARWIARAHGGDLTLESSSPTGSTFLLALPPTR